MVTKPEFIRQFEEKTGTILKQVPLEKIVEKESWLFISGKRAFSVNKENKIIALSLDHIPQFLWLDLSLIKLQEIEYLSICSVKIFDYSFLKDIKRLNSLDLSGNNIKNISFLKELKGLTSLNLSENNIQDISFLKELKGLTSLNLGWNKEIKDYSFLKELKGLTSLNLGWNKEIKDYSFLKELKGLTSLDLSENDIQDISFLKELKGLTSLNFNGNNILNFSFLTELKKLTSLQLSNNNIQDISFVKELKGLTSLDLGWNKEIIDYSFLKDLKGLNSLDLGWNNIKDISFLEDLKGLTSLDLRSNNIQDYSCLKELKRLISLDLRSNNIQDASFLTQLKGLIFLYLRSSNIQDISILKDLKDLTSLDLSWNNKIKDYSILRELKGLTYLNLGWNRIQNISFLTSLKSLNSLYLRTNFIKDISFLTNLKELTSLDLSWNRIQNISFLIGLKGLTSLYLRGNFIKDISIFSELKGLASLDISETNIRKVPKELFALNMNPSLEQDRTGLNLFGNPIEEPPVEIIKEGKEAVLSYFKSLRSGTILLNEVKVLIVGEGMAGKTSVLKQLKGLKFDKHESQTHGVNIETLQLPEFKRLETEELKDIKAHFWDFGGQEVMHASHRFFLSQRSLYILILDSRTDNKKDYWLKHISSFGGDAPTIVVINKIDDNAQYDVERKSLNRKYPFIENRFHKISCKSGLNIQNLKETITETLPKTKLFGTPISINWLKAKDELISETKANRYINKTSFENICINNHVTDLTEQKTLLHFLNDLGIILHFDNLNLENVFVLDPHWVTVGVYRIINSGRIQNGVLKTSDLGFILNEEKIKRTEYDPNKSKSFRYEPQERNYIIQVMKEFELCYELNRNELLIPDLLPKEPDFETNFKEEDVLRFNFKYDFIHPSVISRFIIQLKNDIPKGKLWRYGMQLKNESSEALVKADLVEKTISICVFGDKLNRRNYFSVLRHALKEINNTFENLEVSEIIPLPDFPRSSVSYLSLLNHEKSQEEFYYDGDLNKKFSVKQLLDGIIDEEQRDKDYKKMKKETDEKGNVYCKIENKIENKFENIGNPQVNVDAKAEAKAKAKSEVNISMEIQNFLGETEMLKEDIKDELEIAGVPEKEIKLATGDIEKAEAAIQEIELAQKENREPKPTSKTRLGRFINDLGDENSTINKTLKKLRKGRDYGVQMAEMYNKIAGNTGMPLVPPLILDVIKKI